MFGEGSASVEARLICGMTDNFWAQMRVNLPAIHEPERLVAAFDGDIERFSGKRLQSRQKFGPRRSWKLSPPFVTPGIGILVLYGPFLSVRERNAKSDRRTSRKPCFTPDHRSDTSPACSGAGISRSPRPGPTALPPPSNPRGVSLPVGRR